MSEEEAYRRGHEVGYADGYAAGRTAGLQDARKQEREAPLPDQRKGNGWVTVTEELREQFDLDHSVERVYITRDLNGDIIGVHCE